MAEKLPELTALSEADISEHTADVRDLGLDIDLFLEQQHFGKMDRGKLLGKFERIFIKTFGG